MTGCHEKVADDDRLDVLKDVSYEPIFIMGDHRSGTTLFYKLLAATDAFNITTAYHVIRYQELLTNHLQGRTDVAREELTRQFRQMNLETRLIDNLELTADTPEEYGLILHAQVGQLALNARSLPKFEEICRKIQFVSTDPQRPLLLKNPWDFGNFITVHRLFPKAKMLFLHRHPVHVMNSQLKAMQKNWHQGNPYTAMLSKTFASAQKRPALRAFMRWATNPHSRIRLAQRGIVYRAKQSMRYFLDHIDQLPSEQFISLGYEDLCQDANWQMRRVMEFLELEFQSTCDFQEEISPRPTRLLPGLERSLPSLERQFAPLIHYHGYGSLQEQVNLKGMATEAIRRG